MVELMQLASAAGTSGRFAVCERSIIRLANSGFNASTFCKSVSERTPGFEAEGNRRTMVTARPNMLRRSSAKLANLTQLKPSQIPLGPTFAPDLLLGDCVRVIMSASCRRGSLAADFKMPCWEAVRGDRRIRG